MRVNWFNCLVIYCVLFPAGFSRSRLQLFSHTRAVCDEVHLPPFVHVRAFSQTAVCFASKDSTPRDGDGGKVLFSLEYLFDV